MLRWLGRTCARHHWVVLGLWLVAVVGGHFAAAAWGGETTNDFSVPGSDSQDALDVLAEDFPQLAGTSAQVVFETPSGKTVADFEDPIQQTVANLGTIDGVASVSNPLAASTELLNSQSSPDGTIAYATVLFPDDASDLPDDTFDQIQAASAELGRRPGWTCSTAATWSTPRTRRPRRSRTTPTRSAWRWPWSCCCSCSGRCSSPCSRSSTPSSASLFAGAVVSLLESQFTIPDVGATLGTMLGLGVGVDYSLFILTRAYGEQEDGADPVEAMGTRPLDRRAGGDVRRRDHLPGHRRPAVGGHPPHLRDGAGRGPLRGPDASSPPPPSSPPSAARWGPACCGGGSAPRSGWPTPGDLASSPGWAASSPATR